MIMININDLDFDNILSDEKSYKNFLIHGVATKVCMVQSLRIIFDKVDVCIRKYDGTKYLALFYSNKKMREFLIEYTFILINIQELKFI